MINDLIPSFYVLVPFLLTLPIPFFASFVLDGLLNLMRGRGPKQLLLAIAFTVLLVVAAAMAWAYCAQQAAGNLALQAQVDSLQKFATSALPILALVALGTFVVRTIRDVSGSRSGMSRGRRQ
ncbi:MAG: hypothetical protein JWQ43_2290 [Glaciihabitans sp.]|nr:hypothetical protein [Glaciihabitans sp.]